MKTTRFIKAITNTMLKSMWQNGLDNISAYARDKHLTRVQNKHLIGMKRMYSKKSCGSAFNLWRNHINAQSDNATKDADGSRVRLVLEHKKFIQRTIDWCCERGLRHKLRMRMINLFTGWRNVTKWLKSIKMRNILHKNNTETIMTKRVLKRWLCRIQQTQKT